MTQEENKWANPKRNKKRNATLEFVQNEFEPNADVSNSRLGLSFFEDHQI